jgi:hypothetical protein
MKWYFSKEVGAVSGFTMKWYFSKAPSAQRSTARTCAGHGRRNGSLRRVDTVLGLATIWRGFSAWHNQY